MIIWKINGSTPASLGLTNVVLRLANQAPDTLSFQQFTAFDGSALYAYGDAIVLTRQDGTEGTPVTWFRGVLRVVPRAGGAAGESIRYEARGGWEILQRRAYLQNFKQANDPGDPDSTLVDVRRGRVVLAQDDTGARVDLESAVSEVLAYAIDSGASLTLGDVQLGAITVPFDEVTDLSCADVLTRLLQWSPDAVVWFDYTTNPPTVHVGSRAYLTDAGTIEVKPLAAADDDGIYAPLESVELTPRPDLQVARVALFFIATNRSNESTWETTTAQVHPTGTTGREDNCLVRTIQLAGSVYDSTVLEQRIKTQIIPASLRTGFSTPLTAAGDPDAFSAVSFWWKQRDRNLAASNVTIKRWLSATIERVEPTEPDIAPVTQPTYELLDGAVTDWMRAYQGVDVEQEDIRARVEIEVADPDNSSKKEIYVLDVSANITAVNTSRQTHTFLEDESFTPAESIPSGLAEAIHASMSVLQWDGAVTLIEPECTGLATVGRLLNLDGALAAWETMDAIIQEAAFQIDDGRTQLRLGAVRAADLAELFISNRTRRPVTSHLVRTSGRRITSDRKQGLGVFQPIKNATATANQPRVFIAPLES